MLLKHYIQDHSSLPNALQLVVWDGFFPNNHLAKVCLKPGWVTDRNRHGLLGVSHARSESLRSRGTSSRLSQGMDAKWYRSGEDLWFRLEPLKPSWWEIGTLDFWHCILRDTNSHHFVLVRNCCWNSFADKISTDVYCSGHFHNRFLNGGSNRLWPRLSPRLWKPHPFLRWIPERTRGPTCGNLMKHRSIIIHAGDGLSYESYSPSWSISVVMCAIMLYPSYSWIWKLPRNSNISFGDVLVVAGTSSHST